MEKLNTSKVSRKSENAYPVYKGEKDLTLITLEKLKGRSTVSKQFISDLTNADNLKQAERDILRKVLEEYADKEVPVKDFARKVKSELIPLTIESTYHLPGGSDRLTRHDGTRLPQNLRGEGVKYGERIFSSPFRTKAGSSHFNSAGNLYSDNYFAHSRVEDLPGETTRRILEIQSDLFQKDRLEENYTYTMQELGRQGKLLYDGKPVSVVSFPYHRNGTAKAVIGGKECPIDLEKLMNENQPLVKLEPYRNTWYERVIREEIRLAAKDGRKVLRFPTGDTAMRIENIGARQNYQYHIVGTGVRGRTDIAHDAGSLKPGKLFTGLEYTASVLDNRLVNASNDVRSVILEVLAQDKFLAVPKQEWENHKRDPKSPELRKLAQAVNLYQYDTSNPIHSFYEKDVQKFLSKFGGKVVTDERGVTWVELEVDKKMAKKPIPAFGVEPLPELEKKPEHRKAELQVIRNKRAPEVGRTLSANL